MIYALAIGVWVLCVLLVVALFRGGQLEQARAQGRVALAELEQWRATANHLARAPLPRVGLPWSTSDSDGDMFMIRRDPDDPEQLIVCVRWVDTGGDGFSACATLGWDARTQAAAALLSVYPTNYTPVGEP